MNVAGIDVSTHAIDLVLLDLDTDHAEWHRYELQAGDLIDRVMSVRQTLPHPASVYWDSTIAIGIEQPAGRYSVDKVAMVFGAVLAGLPKQKVVKAWRPAEWRKACGLKGNAPKEDIYTWAVQRWVFKVGDPLVLTTDATDAYCIAHATRSAIEVVDSPAESVIASGNRHPKEA